MPGYTLQCAVGDLSRDEIRERINFNIGLVGPFTVREIRLPKSLVTSLDLGEAYRGIPVGVVDEAEGRVLEFVRA